uniref:Large ribosomal subunit protein mL44 n=1 Tax=Arion vulgaris TaxID=1028688 RepID=A0A0B6ZRL0_9EUPU
MASSLIRSCIHRLTLTASRTSVVLQNYVPRRNHNQYLYKYLREMYSKRINLGPEKLRRRSEWINWNYDSEIYSFGKRLGEDFQDATLRQAFIHTSYLEGEKRKRAELGIDVEAVPLQLQDNIELANLGSGLISAYVKVYLRNMYPYMFEECIEAAHDYLMTEEMLCNIAKHIGCEDLILTEELPVYKSTLGITFKAVVGALLKDKGKERAEKFVRDFVLTQLVGKDITEMWELINPMGLLTAVLAVSGRGAPESRLLWKSGVSTVMSLYWVGIYSDKQLVAKSPGETVLIAEEMAAREGIKKIMKTEDSRPPLVLGTMADNLKLDYQRKNLSAEEVIRKHFGQGIQNARAS